MRQTQARAVANAKKLVYKCLECGKHFQRPERRRCPYCKGNIYRRK